VKGDLKPRKGPEKRRKNAVSRELKTTKEDEKKRKGVIFEERAREKFEKDGEERKKHRKSRCEI